MISPALKKLLKFDNLLSLIGIIGLLKLMVLIISYGIARGICAKSGEDENSQGCITAEKLRLACGYYMVAIGGILFVIVSIIIVGFAIFGLFRCCKQRRKLKTIVNYPPIVELTTTEYSPTVDNLTKSDDVKTDDIKTDNTLINVVFTKIEV